MHQLTSDLQHPTLPKYLRNLLLVGCAAIVMLILLPWLFPLDGETNNDWFIFLGRFHIVVLHLPIGWLTLVPLLELFFRKYQIQELQKAIHIILCIAALSAFTAVIFGITLASSDGYSGQTVTNHMWLGIITSIAIILACIFNEAKNYFKQKILGVSYALCIIVSLSTITVGGHLGGELVQGEGYLTEKLPIELKIQLGIEEPEVLINQETPIYAGFIKPVLSQKCISCHSAQKVKGKFRVDNTDDLFKGGKSKKTAIIPGDINNSELIHRITLSSEDDQSMPPDGRTPLDAKQVELFRWWVNIGAPLESSINELSEDQLTPKIELILEEIITASRERLFPRKAYTSIDADILINNIERLESEYGLDIVPLSQDPKDGLQISSYNTLKKLDDQAWQTLQPLAEFIYSADFGQTEITQKSIESIAMFNHLEILMLNGATLTDVSLTPLINLKNLKVLNLFDTSIDDTNAKAISNIRSLKKLYLAQTNIQQAGLVLLKANLKRTTIFHNIKMVEPESSELVPI